MPFPPAAAGALSPHFAATGDFNGDGHLDLATANTYPIGTVSVMLGVGDGTFQAARSFTAGSLPFGIVAGDFNRDGRLDLATTNQGSSDISVLLSRGDGTFAPEVRYAAGTGGWELDTADLNGDGFLDLVSANVTSRDDFRPAGPGRRHLPIPEAPRPGGRGLLRGLWRLQRRWPARSGGQPRPRRRVSASRPGRRDVSGAEPLDRDGGVFLRHRDGATSTATAASTWP